MKYSVKTENFSFRTDDKKRFLKVLSDILDEEKCLEPTPHELELFNDQQMLQAIKSYRERNKHKQIGLQEAKNILTRGYY